MPRVTLAIAVLLACVAPLPAAAQAPNPATPQACTSLDTDAERLACYDNAFGRDVAIQVQAQIARNAAQARQADDNEKTVLQRINPFARSDAGIEPLNPSISRLDRRWELSTESKLGIFNLRAHRPVYLLPVFYSTEQNTRPTSPNPMNTLPIAQPLDATEAKFQLSLKTKAIEGVFGDAGDLWLGYTQSSRWQVFDTDTSRPFRETNYEPEAMLVFRTNYSLFGWDGRLLGIGASHHSNGRDLPHSRSWNRVMLNLGLERGDWVVMLRPWARIHEDRAKDDNPDINDYMGRGDLTVVRTHGNHELALIVRHTLRGGDRSRGAAQLDWGFPIGGALRGHLQIFDGYGESMIDYNHRATYIGLGVSLLEWY